jgi:hypothetical protein
VARHIFFRPARCGYTLRVTSHKHLIHLSTLHKHNKYHYKSCSKFDDCSQCHVSAKEASTAFHSGHRKRLVEYFKFAIWKELTKLSAPKCSLIFDPETIPGRIPEEVFHTKQAETRQLS